MLLASMYQQKGDTNKAKALCRTLVARPTGQGLLFASEFYASHGQRKAAKQAIGKLSQLRLPAGHAAMLRGQYLAATGQVKQAVATLRQAVAKAPADARIWRTAIRFELTANLAKQAVQTAQQALTKLGGRRGHEGIAAIVDHAPAVRVFANTQFQPLVLALLEDEQNRTTAGQVLDLLRAAKQTNTAKHLATQLTKIADGHIDFLALQDAAAAVDMGVGQTSDAARLATRAMARFPAAAKPAQLAAEARATLQQWNRGLVAAQTWRDRMSGSKEPADQLIGQAQEQLGLPNAAVRTLGRYIDKAMKTPTKHYDLIRLYAQALVDAGQVNRAEKLLQPMLIDSTSRWRLLWLNLATYGIQDPATAASWLEQLEPTIPTGATPERIALARAWWSLAARAQKSAYQKRARTIIDQVVQSNQTSQQAWFLRGLMAEAVDKLDVAKRSYEHAIKLDGKLAAAKNNLAMVLLHQHGDLERAIKLAKDAVQAAPKNANFLDTLAQVEAAHQAYAAAIRTIEKAIKLQPHNQQWQNRLAAIKRAQPDTAMK